jgi:hypothetical protein
MIHTISCAVSGCESKFETNEPVSPKNRFICRHHPRKVQTETAGRPYEEEKDNQDREVHFQTVAFDPELARSGTGKKKTPGMDDDGWYDAGATVGQES